MEVMTTADLIGALNKKRHALIARRLKLTEDYERSAHEIDVEIDNIDKAIDTLNEALKDYVCPACGGTGEESYTDAAGGRDYRKCSRCGGTGVKR